VNETVKKVMQDVWNTMQGAFEEGERYSGKQVNSAIKKALKHCTKKYS
jgi:hypothetical protein